MTIETIPSGSQVVNLALLFCLVNVSMFGKWGERALSPSVIPESALRTYEFEVPFVDSTGRIIRREKHRAQYFVEDLGEGVVLEMIQIPGGKFLMGSEGDPMTKPVHEVIVAPFFLATYELTRGQWEHVLGLPRVNRQLRPKVRLQQLSLEDERRLAVDGLFWSDGVEVCERLSRRTGRRYRLPSEAEWEYSCRAGSTTLFHFGESISPEVANYGKRGYEIAPVGSFAPNKFGLHDSHGNVSEWCADRPGDDYVGAPSDSKPWLSKNKRQDRRVLRGGAYGTPDWACQSSARLLMSTSLRATGWGLRVAADIEVRH